MRLFKFWNANGDEKETEQISLKKAIMSVQGNFKDIHTNWQKNKTRVS